MVNTGMPSRDCETCRQRRVKCDLVRPSCRRCQSVGRTCTYRDLNKPEVAFLIQTPTTFPSRKTRSKKQPVSNKPANPSLASQGSHARALSGVNAKYRHVNGILLSMYELIPPSCGIIESWDAHIVPLLVDQFSFPTIQGSHTHCSLEGLSQLIFQARAGSTLHLVAYAVGHVYLANRAKSVESAILHKKLYGRFLLSLRADLSHSSRRREDSILLAVWFACLYELMSGDGGSYGGPVNWDIHSRALGLLLKSRGFEQFNTTTGRQLFQLAYHYIQIQSLRSITDPAPESREWFNAIQSRTSIDQLFFIPSFFHGDEVARACREAISFFNEATSTAAKLTAVDTLVHACDHLKILLDASVDECPISVPEASVNQMKKSQSGQLRRRNHVDACILRMHSISLELLFKTVDLLEICERSAKRISHLQDMVSEESQIRAARILSTLPYLLPDYGSTSPSWAESLRMTWPLRMILGSAATAPEAKNKASLALKKIAYEGGIMQAVGLFYPTNSLHVI